MNYLFEKALGVEETWYVNDIDSNAESRRLDISVDFQRDLNQLAKGFAKTMTLPNQNSKEASENAKATHLQNYLHT